MVVAVDKQVVNFVILVVTTPVVVIPHYISSYPNEEYDIYEGVEHLKGVKAPNIPIVDIKEETQNQIRKLWDNFDNL